MNFQRGRQKDEPRIDFVPLIDVLLVILIFLMVTTTYNRFSELQINLPEAGAEKLPERPNEITVAVDPAGQYAVNNQPVRFTGLEVLVESLRRAAAGAAEPVIVIAADAKASHQSVVNVMEAARMAGYHRITFTTQARER